MFLEAGSSGVLSKPTKLEDLLKMLQSNMGLYVSQGLLQLSEDRVVMDDGALQLGTRFSREGEETQAASIDRGKIQAPWAGGATQRSAEK